MQVLNRIAVLNRMTFAVFLLAMTTISPRADAQCQEVVKIINNPDPQVGDWFGNSVAIEGNYILVGAYLDDAGATDAGSAYLFDAVTGSLLHTFNNPAPGQDDRFGSTVAISGNYVVVGAPLDNPGATDAGSVYVFDAVTGSLIRQFNHPTPAAEDHFGASLAISGINLLIGAPGDGVGSAFLFNVAALALAQTFNDPAPNASGFGESVAIWGDNILVNSNHGYFPPQRIAYLFDAPTARLLQTFIPPSGAYGGIHAVAISEITVVGSVPGTQANVGRVHRFDAATGTILRTFNNPSPEIMDFFGASIAISGNKVLVGAHGDDTSAANAGSAYLFDAATGSLVTTINNPEVAADEFFGWAVAISGDNVLVGAPNATGGNGVGRVYLFPPSVRCGIFAYLLNGGAFSPELDLNADGAIDVADLIASP